MAQSVRLLESRMYRCLDRCWAIGFIAGKWGMDVNSALDQLSDRTLVDIIDDLREGKNRKR